MNLTNKTFLLMKIFFSLLLLLLTAQVNAQSIFDKVENNLLEKHFQINYGVQLAWYKVSNIHFVQEQYNRNVEYQYVSANANGSTLSVLRGKVKKTPQFKVSFGIDLSQKYSLLISATHISYYVDVDKSYYRRGIWNGQMVSDSIYLQNDFRRLEHSNGINIWNIGVKRKIRMDIKKWNAVRFELGMMPNLGLVYTASQGEIKNPTGQYEHYDPGNSLAGFNYALEAALALIIKEHWQIQINLNYFEMFIKRAKLDENAYVKQRLRGSNYGLNIGYKF